MSNHDSNQIEYQATKSEPKFFVVGIGVSAGGLQALEELFAHLPADTGAAFVVLQHLSPDVKSLRKELLERHTDMVVHRVMEGMKLQPNSVYLIPPGQNLTVEANLLWLEEQNQDKNDKKEFNFPIDLFLTSLAKNYGERAIGIILSGLGGDGTHGLRAINEAGGITLVQDPETAEFDGMPRSALATGVVNQILPPLQIAQLVYQCVVSPRGFLEKESVESNENSLLTYSSFKTIANFLLETEDIDFSHYKTSTMSRRIHRRRLINNFDNVTSYIEFLRNSSEERKILCSDLLINVTHFFRDTAVWESLENEILPILIEQTKPHEELRFWVTACSTGEEAYSLAILLREALEDLDKPLTVKIFATDINRTALEKAAAGIYPPSIANDITSERLQKYFIFKDNHYQVIRQLRAMLIFSPHDLTKDISFTRINLISCRNVLIYMQSELQQQIIRNFHSSLVVKGMLFLGEAESVGIFKSEFKPLHTKGKIYQKRRDLRLPFPAQTVSRINANSSLRTFKPKISSNLQSIQEHSLQRILQETNSVILLVNPENRLLHVYGDSSKIFKPLRGEIATEVTKMVVLPLQLPLNTALYRARKEKKSVIYTDIQLGYTDGNYSISLKVIPPKPKGKNGDFYLVEIQQEALTPSPEVSQVEEFKVSHEAQQRILELEHELQYTHENLQASIEELETTNEELTASNEELNTVNIEYQSKIQELTQLNNDVDNLLKSTDIGVIFLDEQLKIRKFTPAATAAISLRHTDLERPLKELTLKIECPQLLELLEEVLENSQSLELEVKLKEDNSYFLMGINPYRTKERRNEGVVISFVQINEIKKVQRQLENTLVELDHTLIELENSKGEINSFFHLSLDMLCIADFDGYFNQINFSFSRILGYSSKELLARPFIEFVHPDDVEATLQEVQKLAEGHDTKGFKNRYRCQDGSYRWFKWMATSHQGLIYAIAHDLTEQKLAQELQIRQLTALETASDGIAILNDDKFIYLNQAYLEIFGYSQPEELIGQSWRLLYEPEQLVQLEREAFPMLSERGQWQGETQAKHRDGHNFDEELTLTFTPRGDLICVCRDISEIKQARQQLVRANVELEQRVAERTQTLADFSNRLKQIHRLATTNYERLEDLFADYLETGCQMFNLSTGIVSQVSDKIYTILAVRSPLNLSVGFEADYQDTYCVEVIEKQTTLSFDQMGAMKNRKEHPVYQNLRLESFISTPIFVNGKIFGTLNFSDTTPRKQEFQSHDGEIIELMARNVGHSLSAWQSKAALEERRTELQQANRAKDNFIAHMNHELRTPLNGILGFTQILQKDPHLTNQQNQNLRLIHHSGRHLLDLINDILNFSKIEADKIELEEQDFNWSDFLDDLVSLSHLRAEQKNLDFHYRFSSSLPQVVKADETRLRQVLLNLLSNSIKFTDRGEVTFQVGYLEDFEAEAEGEKGAQPEISQSSIQNHQIRFQIKDTGIGIPEHKLADIFLPFEQVHQMRAEEKGTGLGLTISQKLIQLMGSQIQVTSTVGEGSIFWFDLDLAEGDPANVCTTNVQSAIQPTGFSGQNRKVLIVDDLADNRQLLVQYLQPLGFQLAEAENGRQGLTLAETFKPHVILLDALMPEMDGREMLQQLRQHPQLQETKVIFVSANSQFKEQLQTSQLQFEDFLDKPVDFNQLLQSLQTHLHLQWLFPESEHQSNSTALVPPPQEQLLKLWELAQMGDMGELETQINSLEQLDSQYLPFVHQVRKLVASFQQNQLIKLLENLRDHL